MRRAEAAVAGRLWETAAALAQGSAGSGISSSGVLRAAHAAQAARSKVTPAYR
ncbi:hypothetical protein [Streptomyces sp. MP131-18]|uniref:hypothetical protein n=1 Tax=Streptomyces sp. MP131-18 TaxID=1857892 RepID=UPI00209AA990|nr:hypothetical protein [Streptomyces sp. MP131-18]